MTRWWKISDLENNFGTAPSDGAQVQLMSSQKQIVKERMSGRFEEVKKALCATPQTQEENAEVVKVVLQARVSEGIVEQIVDLPAPQLMEIIEVTRSNPQDVPVHGRCLERMAEQSVDNHVHRRMKEIVPETPSEVHKFSSQDRISLRTVQQIFDASVVEVIRQVHISGRGAVSLFEEPKFSSRDKTWNRTVELFATLLLLVFRQERSSERQAPCNAVTINGHVGHVEVAFLEETWDAEEGNDDRTDLQVCEGKRHCAFTGRRVSDPRSEHV